MDRLQWSYTIRDSEKPPCLDTIVAIKLAFNNKVIVEYTIETQFEWSRSYGDEYIRCVDFNPSCYFCFSKSLNDGKYLLLISTYLPNPNSDIKLNIPQDILKSLWDDLILECVE